MSAFAQKKGRRAAAAVDVLVLVVVGVDVDAPQVSNQITFLSQMGISGLLSESRIAAAVFISPHRFVVTYSSSRWVGMGYMTRSSFVASSPPFPDCREREALHLHHESRNLRSESVCSPFNRTTRPLVQFPPLHHPPSMAF